MSLNTSTGVRKRDSSADRIDEVRKENEQNLIQNLKIVNGESNDNSTFQSGDGVGAQATGNGFIDIMTGAFNGAIAIAQQTAEIVSEKIDIFRDDLDGSFASNVKLVTDVANDTLDFITGGDLPGQILKLVGDDTLDTLIRNVDAGVSSTTNILFPNFITDFTLKAGEIIEFLYDETKVVNGNTGCWCYSLGDASSGGGGVSFPLDFPEDDRGSPGSSVTVDYTESDRHYQEITLTEDITVNLTNFTAGTTQLVTFRFIQNATGGHTVTFNPTLDNTVTIGTGSNEITDVFVKKSFDLLIGIIEGAKIFQGSDASQWATFEAVDDVDFNTFDGIDIDRLLFDQNTGESLIGTSTGITSDSSGNLNSNVPSGTQHIFRVNANTTASFTIAETGIISQTIIPVGVDDLGSGVAPWNNIYGNTGVFGELEMSGDIDLGGNDITDVNDIGDTTDPLNDLFVNRIRLQTGTFVTNKPTITSLTGNSIDIHVPTGATINLDYQGTSPSPHIFSSSSYNSPNIILSNTLTFNDSSTDPVSNGAFTRNGVDVKVFSGGSVRNLSDIGALKSEIVDGDSKVLVTDTGVPANAKIEFILNNSVVGGFTPVSFLPTIPIDMSVGLNILNIDNLRFLVNSGTIPVSATGFVIDSNGLRLNVEDSADLFTLTYNSATITHQFSSTALTSPNLITNNTLIINDSSTDPITNGIFSRNGNRVKVESEGFVSQRTTSTSNQAAIFSLVKIDASPSAGDNVGNLNFALLDSPTETIYSQIRSEIRDVTNAGRLYLSVRTDNSSLTDAIEIIGNDNADQTFMNVNARVSSNLVFGVETGGTFLKIFPAINTIGITFDNISYTGGSAGTFAPPSNATVPATIAGLNALAGDHDTSIVIQDSDAPATFFMWVKQKDGNWGGVALTRDIITS